MMMTQSRMRRRRPPPRGSRWRESTSMRVHRDGVFDCQHATAAWYLESMSRFAARLVENMRRATAGLPIGRISDLDGRIVAVLRDDAAWPAARERLARV